MTDKIDDGGAAFALHIPGGERPVMGGRIEYIAEKYYPGMSLRDWFAGQIIAGLIAFDGKWGRTSEHFGAEAAYDQADAMIAEKRRREGK